MNNVIPKVLVDTIISGIDGAILKKVAGNIVNKKIVKVSACGF